MSAVNREGLVLVEMTSLSLLHNLDNVLRFRDGRIAQCARSDGLLADPRAQIVSCFSLLLNAVKYAAFQVNVCIRKRICRQKFAYFDLHCGVKTIFHDAYFILNSFKKFDEFLVHCVHLIRALISDKY